MRLGWGLSLGLKVNSPLFLFFFFFCFSPRLFELPCSPFFRFSFISLFSSRFSSHVFSQFHQFLVVELGSYVYYVFSSFAHKFLIFNSSPKGSSSVGESFLLYLFFFLLRRVYGLRHEVLDNFDVSFPFPRVLSGLENGLIHCRSKVPAFFRLLGEDIEILFGYGR